MIYAPSVGTSPAFRQRVLARPSGTCSKDTERGFGRRSTRAAPAPIAQVLDIGERDVRVLGEGQHVKGELAQLQLRGGCCLSHRSIDELLKVLRRSTYSHAPVITLVKLVLHAIDKCHGLVLPHLPASINVRVSRESQAATRQPLRTNL